jgi:hypothetical protein
LRSLRIFGVLLAAGLATALILAPAEADHKWGHCDTVIHHPSDPDRLGSGRPNSYACEWWNNWIKVCDRHVDGNRVRAWVEGQFAPGRPRPTGWAPSRSCHAEGTSYGTGNIIRYRVCVEDQGCSRWRRPY